MPAVEEGIVPGGGIALVRAQRALDTVEGLTVDELVGVNIIRRALEQPLKLIVENAGSEGAVVLDQVKHQSDDYGYDAELGEFGPMLERGIIDPVKVTRSALQNAASVAAMVLTTESMITEIPEAGFGHDGRPPDGFLVPVNPAGIAVGAVKATAPAFLALVANRVPNASGLRGTGN